MGPSCTVGDQLGLPLAPVVRIWKVDLGQERARAALLRIGNPATFAGNSQSGSCGMRMMASVAEKGARIGGE
jgi:hypothetical protein